MNQDQVTLNERVQAILVEALQVEPQMIVSDSTFGDLPQWDSLGHMEVMMRLEEYFGIEINTDTIAALISVPEICTYLEINGLA